MAQQRNGVVFLEGGEKHLKLVGHLYDQVCTVDIFHILKKIKAQIFVDELSVCSAMTLWCSLVDFWPPT